ncbi:MAG TPA: hypothetical protein VHS53_03700, partial [Mucilaginibacter sp.]|nr:hypothetical protein [Mucilaginibacter sp.]
MKKYCLIALTILHICAVDVFGQTTNSSPSTSRDSSSIKTTVFWIDLCNPSENGSVKKMSGSNKFEISWKNNLAFGIKNINQYKYDYAINSVSFSAFVDTNYNLNKNSLNAQFNATINNFYQLQQYQNTFQNKKAISHYLNSLDSIKILNDTILKHEDDILSTYETLNKAGKVKADAKISGFKKDLNNNFRNYDRIAEKLKDLAILFDIKEQANSINNILTKLAK